MSSKADTSYISLLKTLLGRSNWEDTSGYSLKGHTWQYLETYCYELVHSDFCDRGDNIYCVQSYLLESAYCTNC